MYSVRGPDLDWTPLRPIPKNGTFAITAPSSPVDDEQQLNRGVRYLEKQGYRVEVGKSCTSEHYYVAGTDASRAYELMDFVEDPKIDAIICARGGYGSMRMLKLLDFELFREKQKPLIGFSDVTALQWAIYSQTGLPSISGPLLMRDLGAEQINPFFEEHFWNLIQDGKVACELDYQQEKQQEVKAVGLAGTIAVGSWILGTPFFPNTHQRILVLEDTEEPVHKIEAHLLQWSMGGLLDKAEAILLGEFTDITHSPFGENPPLEEVFNRVFEGIDRPVIRNFPYGHISPKVSLPIGVPYTLHLGEQSRLEIPNSIFES